MIQTQLLKSDKPYQIISAAGMVGIQVATLIVTEEKTLDDGRYIIDTHSHPVVNYASKEGLVEDLKYFKGDSSNPFETYEYTTRMQPEGAVWNKVEVRDVRVLGLVGANNFPVEIAEFMALVPSLTPDNPLAYLWDGTTANKMSNLFFGLERFGIKVKKEVAYSEADYDFADYHSYKEIALELEEVDGSHQVLVKIRNKNYEYYPITDSLYFRCRLEDNPESCISTIESCFAELSRHFDFQKKLRYIYRRKEEDKANKWADLLEKVADSLNSNLNPHPTEG